MRLSSIRDYIKLRAIAENAGEVIRIARSKTGGDLEVRLRDGRRLHLRPQSRDYHIFRRIFLDDTYRVGEMEAIPGCVLDIGANAGIFASRVAPQAERVLCYEPSSANFPALERNLRTLPNAETRRAAVAGQPGTVRLYIPNTLSHSGQSSLYPEVDGYQWENYEDVAATTLDDIFRTEGIERCGLLKLDVEGAEYEILAAAGPDVLAATDAICGEYHQVASPEHGGVETLLARLENAGFHLSTSPDRKHPGHGLFFARRPGSGTP